jgi:hypothetical protein
MLDPVTALLILISFRDLSLGLFVFLRNPKNRVNINFALLELFILVWINASYFQDEVTDPAFMYFLPKIDYASVLPAKERFPPGGA